MFAKDLPAFDAWRQASGARQAVRIVSTEHFPESDGAASYDFVVFTTTLPLDWDDKALGFAPNVAAAHVTSASDVSQRPEPDPGLTLPTASQLSDSFASAIRNVAIVIVIVGGALAVTAIVDAARRRGR